MKSAIKIGVLFSMAAAVCLADTWTGKLVDAACMDQQSQEKTDACPATKATAAFAIVMTDGRVLRLDSAGNGKAADAMKSASNDQPIQATVSGDLTGHVVTVETFALQQ